LKSRCSLARLNIFPLTKPAHRLRKRGVEAKLVIASKTIATPEPDLTLIAVIAKAHLWLDQLTSWKAPSINDLAQQQNTDRNEISRFLPLAYLAPDIVEKVLEGTQPVDLTVQRLRNLPALPHSWNEQRMLLGFTG
jgi:site-specific DNA recombinase